MKKVEESNPTTLSDLKKLVNRVNRVMEAVDELNDKGVYVNLRPGTVDCTPRQISSITIRQDGGITVMLEDKSGIARTCAFRRENYTK